MSTNGYESWAVDLKDVGAVYPFQGSETLMVWIAVGLWVLWHIWQLNAEGEEIRSEIKANHRSENINKSVDRY